MLYTLFLTMSLASPDAASLLAPDGADQLDSVGALTFTFNVERDGARVGQRTWTWEPATGRVTRTQDGSSLSFTFGAPEGDTQSEADAQFVNDSFWLMPQLHISWATEATLTASDEQPLPIGEGTARVVTVQYPRAGGYTPGDAYDLFVDADGHIVAWHYRKSGSTEPSMTTTFESPQQVGPLRIATEHRSADGAFRLYFTDLAVRPSTP